MKINTYIFWFALVMSLLISCSDLFCNYSGGTGSYSDPYIVANSADIEQLMTTQNDWNKHFILNSDIDCSTLHNFTPIGNSSTPFSGSFDGKYHKIKNIVFSSSETNCVGLFGCNIGNLKNIGALNCKFTGKNEVGGLCGSNINGTIKNCFSTGEVVGTKFVGGFCGSNFRDKNNGIIENCYSSVSVRGSGENQDVGGFCGINAGENCTIKNCYSTGEATGEKFVGGFCGVNNKGVLYNCYSIGAASITSDENTYIGGFCGYNVPGWGSPAVIAGCFWDIETSGNQSSDGGGEGKTSAEMMMQNTYEGYDFDEVWCMVEGKTYPHLQAIEDCDNLVSVDQIPQYKDISIAPNPFSQSTIINYELREAGHISLELFDMLGNRVATLVDGWQDAGKHQAVFNVGNTHACTLPAGMYMLKMQAGGEVFTKKIVHLK